MVNVSYFLYMQKYMADILSVLALTMSAEGERVRLLRLIFKKYFVF